MLKQKSALRIAQVLTEDPERVMGEVGCRRGAHVRRVQAQYPAGDYA